MVRQTETHTNNVKTQGHKRRAAQLQENSSERGARPDASPCRAWPCHVCNLAYVRSSLFSHQERQSCESREAQRLSPAVPRDVLRCSLLGGATY